MVVRPGRARVPGVAGSRREVHDGLGGHNARAVPVAERRQLHEREVGADDRALPVARRLAAIAERHGNRVTTADLLGAGLSSAAISRWVAGGRLYREARGVYRLGHRAQPVRGPLAGALLAVCGRATLGFHAAAWIDGWGPQVPPPFDVLVPPTASGRSRAARIHRVELPAEQRIHRHGLPITRADRTLLDMGTVLGPDRLESLVAEALVQRRTTIRTLDEIARRRAGAQALRAALAHEHGPALTRSEVEVLLRRLIRDGALAPARHNVRVHGHFVDAFWPAQLVALEVDSLRFHRHAAKFERDRRKGLDLEARGVRLLRTSALPLRDQPLVLVARVASALALAGRAG